jgi:uncharacterized Tic20 family protein
MEDYTITKQSKTIATLCHLFSFCGYLIPFVGGVLGPMILWLLKRKNSEFIDIHGKESVNFQISILVYTILSALLITAAIGFILLGAVAIFNLVCVILASIRANDGELYRYPFCIRLIH